MALFQQSEGVDEAVQISCRGFLAGFVGSFGFDLLHFYRKEDGQLVKHESATRPNRGLFGFSRRDNSDSLGLPRNFHGGDLVRRAVFNGGSHVMFDNDNVQRDKLRGELATLREEAIASLERRGYEVRGKTPAQIRRALKRRPKKRKSAAAIE